MQVAARAGGRGVGRVRRGGADGAGCGRVGDGVATYAIVVGVLPIALGFRSRALSSGAPTRAANPATTVR